MQCAQLVARLGGDHDDRQVAVPVIGLQSFDDLESVHAGHLQVEQDQVVAVLPMQRADFGRRHRRGDVRVAGFAQHLLEQLDIGLLVVDDQDAGAANVLLGDHHAFSLSAAGPLPIANGPARRPARP